MQLEEIAGPVAEILFDYDQTLKDGGGFWCDVNEGYLPEDLVLAARREEIAWVHSEGVREYKTKRKVQALFLLLSCSLQCHLLKL